jgi:hypothetical protein
VSDASWTFAQARDKALEAEGKQHDAEKRLAEAYREAGAAERAYKEALAKKILNLKAAGVAWTVCGDLARGDETVAGLREVRDITLGAREAANVAVWRHKDNRKDSRGFASWSERREMAEGFGQVPAPDWEGQRTFGRAVPAGVDPKTGELRPAA